VPTTRHRSGTVTTNGRPRASQINDCAHWIDMHSKDARRQGESEQRLYALNAWRETPFFTDRERSALALTEAVTLLAREEVRPDIIEEASTAFNPDELTKLLYLIIEINAWNRLAITTGTPEPGSYVPSTEHVTVLASPSCSEQLTGAPGPRIGSQQTNPAQS